MNPFIHIALFGRFSVRCEDHLLLDHAPPRVQELLAYLVLNRGRAQPREALAERLWRDAESPHRRKYLRNALWQLQSGLLAVGRRRAARLLRAEADWIELDPDSGVAVDADGLEQAFAEVKGVRGDALGAAEARGLAEAARLYRGDLLEGWSAEWCAYDRDRFRRMVLTVLDKLTEYHESCQGYEAGIAYATLALRHDHARERTHRSMMRLLAKSGDRTAALRQYDRCAEALREELAVEPETETVALREMIRAGCVVGAVPETRLAAEGGSGPTGRKRRGLAVVPGAAAGGSGDRSPSG
jgi:DNA-binding SARP family transcriptional activator